MALDKTVKDRAEELIPPEFNKFRREAQEQVAIKGAHFNAHGTFHSSMHVSAIHAICVEQVEKRAEAVWQIFERVMKTVGVEYTDTLAQDLQSFVEHYVPVSLWELPELYARVGTMGQEYYDREFRIALLEARGQVLNRTRAEINLYVDGLRARAKKAAVPAAKERDQKFGILLSPKQAVLDFDEWKARLNAGTSIAVLFIDIDNFKDQNTRHTETVVDKTLLPDVLRLLADLVDQRGAAYQQGGDEFVLILPNYDKAEAMAFAEKVRSRIASQKFQVGEQTESLTISGGVALWPEHGSTYDDVLARANLAKRAAKEKRNTIIPFS